jgi:hypothetical protein
LVGISTDTLIGTKTANDKGKRGKVRQGTEKEDKRKIEVNKLVSKHKCVKGGK